MIPSQKEKEVLLAELIERIKKELNITIEIPRVSGISPRCINDSEKFCIMRFNHETGFQLSTSGTWVSPSEAVEYATKLLNIAKAAKELNQLYKLENGNKK